ncbi:MAG TPA: hypothetical protein VGH37_10440 [Candidatus Acidoferrum sp.]|jgi:hypothetical protein
MSRGIDVAAKRISQQKLASILKQRKRIEDLEASLKEAEGQLLADLKSGATVQAGLFVASVKTWERRNVAWKEILVREKGQPYADKVLAGTKPESYEKLVVDVG